ncbi:DNA-3-methyladenine glycosylase [Salibacterium salarium]|uniref:Putative 3-methyladenine DNA glycosylase n=1 Tax=Salibacterium salarium TaxID=284579 RepID=A0A428N1V9_9BACI|nr:DNA-3-methyladenine glycosylase [Salibacterium salarium]RSL32455.1 DNA-3-methyladenine glycosylase [Salibacterium salarium]
MSKHPISRKFFYQGTLDLAYNLLGKILYKETAEGLAAGKIVETEAYLGIDDRAAHSYGNKRTKRTEIMYGEPGYVYTFEMHTHCLVNVVSELEGQPEAVLIRALEPITGLELMYERRKVQKEKELTNGPGKLTKALGIIKQDYGCHFSERPLYITEGEILESISSGPRIGIEKTGEARFYPYRFWETGNRFVSK